MDATLSSSISFKPLTSALQPFAGRRNMVKNNQKDAAVRSLFLQQLEFRYAISRPVRPQIQRGDRVGVDGNIRVGAQARDHIRTVPTSAGNSQSRVVKSLDADKGARRIVDKQAKTSQNDEGPCLSVIIP